MIIVWAKLVCADCKTRDDFPMVWSADGKLWPARALEAGWDVADGKVHQCPACRKAREAKPETPKPERKRWFGWFKHG